MTLFKSLANIKKTKNDTYEKLGMSDHDAREYNRDFWIKFSKNIFEFTKNILTVATLSFVSQKTDSYFLLFISAALGIIILIEISSRFECFVHGWLVTPNTSKFVSIAIGFAISIASYFIVFSSISKLSVSLK